MLRISRLVLSTSNVRHRGQRPHIFLAATYGKEDSAERERRGEGQGYGVRERRVAGRVRAADAYIKDKE